MAGGAVRFFGRLFQAWVAWLLITGVIAGAVTVYAVVIEPRRIVVERVSFEIRPRAGTLRDGTYRVAFVSDFDLTAPPGRFENRVRDVVNGLEPDLIAFGGDILGGDPTPPTAEALDPVLKWLGGFRARDGVVMVWGEQELNWPEKLRERLPANARELHYGAEIREAGTARIRFCGPEGIFPPLWVEPAAGGRLLAGWGRSAVTARYKDPAATTWTGVDVTARIALGAAGDGPGIAVLEQDGRPGYQVRVSPTNFRWTLRNRRGAEWSGQREDRGVFVQPGLVYSVRVRVDPGAAATHVQSRIWLADSPEPSTWPIDIVDVSADRPRQGAVGVVAGGAWTGGYRQAWEAIEVRDLAGRVLLSEEFDDAARFAERWENPGGRLDDFDTTVVIAHTPRFLRSMGPGQSGLLDVVLAGHSHGGQVRLPFFGPMHIDPDFPRSWSAGWVRLDFGSVWLYTSRGLASSRVPVRLNSPPEVTELTLHVRARPPR